MTYLHVPYLTHQHHFLQFHLPPSSSSSSKHSRLLVQELGILIGKASSGNCDPFIGHWTGVNMWYISDDETEGWANWKAMETDFLFSGHRNTRTYNLFLILLAAHHLATIPLRLKPTKDGRTQTPRSLWSLRNRTMLEFFLGIFPFVSASLICFVLFCF